MLVARMRAIMRSWVSILPCLFAAATSFQPHQYHHHVSSLVAIGGIGSTISNPIGKTGTSTNSRTAMSLANGSSAPPPSPAAPIPITILSGFLGSGKTSLLQNMLQNKEGLRIAVIVNDVASVNIDGKLVARQDFESASDAMIQLQNGCACCSLSDELITSISELVTINDLKADGQQFHHIVVEMSGVADPKLIRSKFQEAELMDMPLMERVRLDTMVTLVDSSAFQSHLESSMLTSRKDTPELFYRDGEQPEDDGDDEMVLEDWMKDMPPALLSAVMTGMKNGATDDEGDPVAELLISQTETADLIIINKVDLVEPGELETVQQITTAINPRAKTFITSFGDVPLKSVLGVAKGRGVVQAGVVDDHRDFVAAAPTTIAAATPSSSSHDHSHGHAASTPEEACEDPEHTDTSHDHSHSHAHSPAEDCVDPECSDDSHDHSHAHSHSHSSNAAGDACVDPNCTDDSHDHSHSHSHSTSTDQLGIGSFVYTARRPFHPDRLVSFLRSMPIKVGAPTQAATAATELDISQTVQDTMACVLRSKGFAWCANSASTALYWSHAGKTYEMNSLGRWWVTLPRNQWPEDAVDYVLSDFDDSTTTSTDLNVSVGDRRQEIVFIGKTLADAKSQDLICKTLDQCLLNDEEWEEYKSLVMSSEDGHEEAKLAERFPNTIGTRMVSY